MSLVNRRPAQPDLLSSETLGRLPLAEETRVMLTMLGSSRRFCDGISRRETLKAGALSALGGFGLPQLLEAKENGDVLPAKAKSVIVLYLLGGAPTQDMYDLKPNAPKEVRGEFNPIATSTPGVEICELLPKSAKWMHKSAIVRSVTHDAGCHNTLPSYTGYESKLPSITITKDSCPSQHGLGLRVPQRAQRRRQPSAGIRLYAVLSRLGTVDSPSGSLRGLFGETLRSPVYRVRSLRRYFARQTELLRRTTAARRAPYSLQQTQQRDDNRSARCSEKFVRPT